MFKSYLLTIYAGRDAGLHLPSWYITSRFHKVSLDKSFFFCIVWKRKYVKVSYIRLSHCLYWKLKYSYLLVRSSSCPYKSFLSKISTFLCSNDLLVNFASFYGVVLPRLFFFLCGCIFMLEISYTGWLDWEICVGMWIGKGQSV